ncbi:HNH endonuclease [Patescibacteria group bacterium]|nr:HNH endonuclease [Patescibacteria group bacterium]
MRKRSWTVEQLKEAVRSSRSYRQVLGKLGLREAGGNYAQVKKYIKEFNLNIGHLKGKGWNKGLHFPFKEKVPLKQILVKGSTFQSFKLKSRLFRVGLKSQKCEECGWAEKSQDGYLPLELDHINGDSTDNRLKNLRILCPNCHSLKPTHRGRNSKRRKQFT